MAVGVGRELKRLMSLGGGQLLNTDSPLPGPWPCRKAAREESTWHVARFGDVCPNERKCSVASDVWAFIFVLG